MDDFRRFPDSSTRQIIDYNRFISLTGNKVFLCLDKGIIEIARYLLNSRGSWRTTYVKEYVGTIGYIMPTETEFQEIKNAIAEANIDMASCDDIVTAINAINTTLQSGAGGGCGCVMSGDTPIDQTGDVPDVTEPSPEGDPPAGNATWEEYYENKCNWIHKILDDYIATLRNYGGFFGLVGGLTVAVIVGVTLISMPPLGLALLMAALGGILTIDLAAFAYFTQIADELEADEDLICELFNSTSTDEMIGVLYAALTEIIPALTGMPPGVESRLLDACQAMNTNTLWQQAIENGGSSPEGYSEVCDCGGPTVAFVTSAFCEATIISGEFTSGEEVTIESCLSGAEIIGAIRHQVAIQTIDYPVNATMEIVSISSGDYIVSWNDGSTPQTPETYGSAAATAGWTNSASALQVSRWTENVTTVPFTVTLRVTTI